MPSRSLSISAMHTSQRENSTDVKLSPQAMVVQGFGEHELKYTRGGDDVCKGVAKATFLQLLRTPTRASYRRLQGIDGSCSAEGNVAATREVTVMSEYPSHDKYLLVSLQGIDTQRRETWRRLAMYVSHDKY
jgi:hypothetical protein